jgi:hypothetical protein
MSTTDSGWFWPTQARKAHYDPGNTNGIALCGKWARINPLTGGAAPFQGGADSPPSTDDCVACRRKLEAGERCQKGSVIPSPAVPGCGEIAQDGDTEETT